MITGATIMAPMITNRGDAKRMTKPVRGRQERVILHYLYRGVDTGYVGGGGQTMTEICQGMAHYGELFVPSKIKATLSTLRKKGWVHLKRDGHFTLTPAGRKLVLEPETADAIKHYEERKAWEERGKQGIPQPAAVNREFGSGYADAQASLDAALGRTPATPPVVPSQENGDRVAVPAQERVMVRTETLGGHAPVSTFEGIAPNLSDRAKETIRELIILGLQHGDEEMKSKRVPDLMREIWQ